MVRLRPLCASDQVVRAAYEAMADDGSPFALGLTPAMTWPQYVSMLEDYRQGIHLPDGIVVATNLVATVDDQIVGRTSIRHILNDALLRRGGALGIRTTRNRGPPAPGRRDHRSTADDELDGETVSRYR